MLPIALGARTALFVLAGSMLGPTAAVAATGTAAPGGVPSDSAMQPRWHERDSATRPPRVSSGEMAFDSARGEMVMFGYPRVGSGARFQTWTWDGVGWERVRTDRHPPRWAPRPVMEYDPIRQEIVLFGGGNAGVYSDETWVFKDGQWSRKHPPTSPPGTSHATAAFDPNLGQIIMFGGLADGALSDDTWAWDGATWTLLQPATSPPARLRSDVAYDPSRDALVLFGGESRLMRNDTWTWDGAVWTKESLAGVPKRRRDMQLATLGQQVVMYGGEVHRNPRLTGTRLTRETWLLTDDRWVKVPVPPVPSRRRGFVFGWDSVRQEAVLYGGYRHYNGKIKRDTWALAPVP